MTNEFHFSQAIKNKKVWAVAAVVIGVAAVADSTGSEYAEYYEPNYNYQQGQMNSYPTGGATTYYPNRGGDGSYLINPSYMPSIPSGASTYPLPSAQPRIQPTYSSDQQINSWRQNQLRQERSHQQFLDTIRN